MTIWNGLETNKTEILRFYEGYKWCHNDSTKISEIIVTDQESNESTKLLLWNWLCKRYYDIKGKACQWWMPTKGIFQNVNRKKKDQKLSVQNGWYEGLLRSMAVNRSNDTKEKCFLSGKEVKERNI